MYAGRAGADRPDPFSQRAGERAAGSGGARRRPLRAGRRRRLGQLHPGLREHRAGTGDPDGGHRRRDG
ncbi:hypothetical protein MB27_17360 [Actinoplanes utahensis]|uniref:Uncharacterized protein n=1 Tax=Actinoplanes utahensis TaxID=1869 RepID=A0A0A6UN11_ACTUT|nr:hypothetical protein MB27_17360 [Actinoplanes utahensis]